MMFFGSTWQGVVMRVTETISTHEVTNIPEVELKLIGWRTDLDDPPAQQQLPRAGEAYWLISDRLFKRLTGDDE